jgi:putative membrane protein
MTTGARFTTLTAAMAGLLLALPACPSAKMTSSHAATKGAKASSSTAFIKEAAMGGMAEVELGNLAQERASSDEVKSFAKRMVDDHTKVNEDLEQVAQKKNVTLQKALDAKHKALYDRLSKLSGKAFDRAYMDAMLADHHHDVAAFQREAKSSDPDVRDFATRSLPTLEQHLASAQQVDRTVAGKTAETSTAGTGQHRATHP